VKIEKAREKKKREKENTIDVKPEVYWSIVLSKDEEGH
jgi:hypothetical protein